MICQTIKADELKTKSDRFDILILAVKILILLRYFDMIVIYQTIKA